MQGKVRFIRKDGRVIPIRVDTNQPLKKNVAANKQSLQHEARSEARDAYHSNFSPTQKATHAKVFGAFKTILAAVGAAGGAKAAFDLADRGASAYHDKAASAKKRYGALALGGTVATTTGIGALAAAARGVGIKAAMHSNLGKASAAAAAIGAGAAGIGFYGVRQANKHLRRVRALRTGINAVKKIANGNLGTFTVKE